MYKKQLSPTGKIYIFLDEVQNIDRWETFVNSYSQDFVNDYELFITGSNSNLLSGELASLLSGRYVEISNLLLIKDNHEKMVVSMDDVKFSDQEGVKHLRPWELE